jgi:hypothetical protein
MKHKNRKSGFTNQKTSNDKSFVDGLGIRIARLDKLELA